MTDEVYEHLVYDREHIPMASLPGMRERSVSISSAAKTFAVTGWKIGWVCAEPTLLGAVRTAKQYLTYVSGAPFQPAVAAALRLGDDYYERLREQLRAQRDQLATGLDELGFEVFPSRGTYFVTTDIRPLGYDDGVEFCLALPERAGVVAVPHSVFYDNTEAGQHLVRWAFCKRPEVLGEALRRLRALRA